MTKKYWEKRINIKNRPSVSLRTDRLIEETMETLSLSMGEALDLLIESPTLSQEMAKKINEYDKSFKIREQ